MNRSLVLFIIIATTAGLGGCNGQGYQRIEFPTQPGHYLQVYEQNGKQWLEIAQVDAKGEVMSARGHFDPPFDPSKRLDDIAVIVGECGRGTFYQPRSLMSKVQVRSWEGAQKECRIPNLSNEFTRLNTKAP